MKTSELSQWLGLDKSTIRLWAGGPFAQYLSETGRGGEGRARNFTDEDARILAHVAHLKHEQIPLEEIHLALQRLQAEDWADLPPMPPVPPGLGPIPMVPREAADTAIQTQRQALIREIVLLQERVDILEEQLANEREQRATEQQTLHKELLEKSTALGELRGKLGALESERQFWIRGLLAVAVVAAVLLAIVLLMALTGGAGG